MEPNTELTPIQLKIINGVANTFSLGEAIDQAGTNRNIVTEWRHTIPAFNEALEKAMRDRAVVNQERIQALVWDAITVMREVLQDKKASPSVRLRAAQTIFKMAAAGTKLEPTATPEEVADPKTEIVHNSAQAPIRLAAEPGRNSLCPCGSGVKFKRCCANPVPQTVPAAA
jgi:uncharacterized protein YecA (UPF0149 family)